MRALLDDEQNKADLLAVDSKKRGNTALHIIASRASTYNSLQTAEVLYERDDAIACYQENKDGLTPVELAVFPGVVNPELATKLVKIMRKDK